MAVAWMEAKSVDEFHLDPDRKATKFMWRTYTSKEFRRRAEPWWVPQLLIERKKVLAARRRCRRCGNLEKKEYEILFCKIRSKFRRSIHGAKWKHCRKILDEVDPGRLFGPHFDWLRGKSSESLKLNIVQRGDGEETTCFMSNID